MKLKLLIKSLPNETIRYKSNLYRLKYKSYLTYWKPYIQQICSKLSSGSWAILKLRQYVDLLTLKTVYFSLIYSHLQYCISSWGLAHANALNPLEKLHKRIIRNITSSPYLEHTTPLFFKLNLLKIHDICNLEIAKNMFQIKNKMTLHDNQIFCLATQMHKHQTRLSSKNNYFILRKRTDFGKNRFLLWDQKYGKLYLTNSNYYLSVNSNGN